MIYCLMNKGDVEGKKRRSKRSVATRQDGDKELQEKIDKFSYGMNCLQKKAYDMITHK